MGFEQRVVVITGASDGIGAELARQLAQERARLALAARRANALDGVRDECLALGGEAISTSDFLNLLDHWNQGAGCS